ncbi:MAG TPA: carbohydrate ABC transporter permease, partial [Bacilli bacterium]
MSIISRPKLNRRTKEDVIFDLVNVIILTGALLLVLYPLYFILIASVSNPDRIFAGDVWFFPIELTFDGYKRIFSDSYLWMGYRNSMIYAVLGTVISLSMILPAAYALSRKDLIGRKFIILLLILTMFFEGGLVPTYLLVKNLNMIDTIWAMVLPSAIGVWNVIVSRIFFETNI